MTREEELDWLCRLRSKIYVFMPREWLIPMNDALDMAIKALEQQKTGHWISFGVQGEIDGQIVQTFTCSECGAISVFRMTSGNIVNGDLCPNCGTKMEVEE